MMCMRKKSKILMIFTTVPYPLRAHGISVRYLPIIEYFSQYHDINIIIIDGNSNDQDIQSLEGYCNSLYKIKDPKHERHNIFTKLATYTKFLLPWSPPISSVSHKNNKVRQSLKKIIQGEKYDVLIWVGSHLVSNLLTLMDQIYVDRIFVDFIDSPSLWVKRYKDKMFTVDLLERYEKWKINKWELKVIREVDSAIYVSDVDANTIPSSLAPGKTRHVIPNGISIGGYTTNSNPDIPSPNIGFLGNMSYGPNIEAVHWLYEQVFLPLRRTMQSLSLIILGRDPVASIQELGKNPGVMVTGTVDDIWPYVNSVNIFVFPIWTGAGMKNKILEAMYAGIPVLTTNVGNEGIDAMAGQELSICQTPEEFQSEVIRMIDNPEERRLKGYSAHKFVMEKYSWDKILPIYENLVNGESIPQ